MTFKTLKILKIYNSRLNKKSQTFNLLSSINQYRHRRHHARFFDLNLPEQQLPKHTKSRSKTIKSIEPQNLSLNPDKTLDFEILKNDDPTESTNLNNQEENIEVGNDEEFLPNLEDSDKPFMDFINDKRKNFKRVNGFSDDLDNPVQENTDKILNVLVLMLFAVLA